MLRSNKGAMLGFLGAVLTRVGGFGAGSILATDRSVPEDSQLVDDLLELAFRPWQSGPFQHRYDRTYIRAFRCAESVRIQEIGATLSQQPHSSAATVLAKAEKLEQLRRKMASIPARSDGAEPATPWLMLRPVDEREPTPIVATAQSTLRMLPVPAPIGDLLPRDGLTRGTVVSVDGAASALIGLLATITAAGGHVAIIGMPGLGLLAFREQGGDLSKVALVPQAKDAAAAKTTSGTSRQRSRDED